MASCKSSPPMYYCFSYLAVEYQQTTMLMLFIFCRTIDVVDQTMSEIQEQTQLASEVSEAISSSTYAGVEFDDVCYHLVVRDHFTLSNRYTPGRT